MKTKLTKDQSDHLMSLGIKFPYKVAIHNGEMAIGPCKDEYPDPNGWYIPISITDLLEILPKEIKYQGNGFSYMCPISITWGCSTGEDHDLWFASYDDYGETGFESQFCNKELIDSLYELCVWTLEQGYLKFEWL